MAGKKKSKKKSILTTRSVTLGSFEIRVSEAKVVIQTKAKNWDISYAEGTTPYYVLCNLVQRSSFKSLETLIMALYSTSIFFVDANAVKEFFEIVGKFKGKTADPLPEGEDETILEEERLRHENNNKEADAPLTEPDNNSVTNDTEDTEVDIEETKKEGENGEESL